MGGEKGEVEGGQKEEERRWRRRERRKEEGILLKKKMFALIKTYCQKVINLDGKF